MMDKKLDEYSPLEALDHIAKQIDYAADYALPEKAQQALQLCDELEKRLDARQLVELKEPLNNPSPRAQPTIRPERSAETG